MIRLDGVDITDIDVRELRRGIGLVSQRPLLFNGTIRANIGFGLASADDAQIENAARLAQAFPFIEHLADGFETEIGDHGVRLSGGQRQRIALARALVKDPQILIFDEATSMYDLEGESAFVEACRDALQGRTIILITHRPASLALADRILCVANGAVHEIATSELPDLTEVTARDRNGNVPEISCESGLRDILSRQLLPSDQAIESRVGDETVILHLENGTYYCLDQTGTQIWGLLKEGFSPTAIKEKLVADYGAEAEVIENDLSAFLSDLHVHGIVADV
jgi:ABC-type polar amino acid transport system ATPase subunit